MHQLFADALTLELFQNDNVCDFAWQCGVSYSKLDETDCFVDGFGIARHKRVTVVVGDRSMLVPDRR